MGRRERVPREHRHARPGLLRQHSLSPGALSRKRGPTAAAVADAGSGPTARPARATVEPAWTLLRHWRRPRSLAMGHATASATTGAQANRLGTDGGVRLEAGDDLRRNRRAEQPLDVAKHRSLVDADQGDGVALQAGATRPTDAVDVVVGDHGQLVVDDVRERLDVEPAS